MSRTLQQQRVKPKVATYAMLGGAASNIGFAKQYPEAAEYIMDCNHWYNPTKPLSQAFEANHLSTPVALRMLHAGEQAGNLGAMMEKTADFYDEEMGRWIEWFVRLFEPLLMVFVGAVIGVVVILMYIPIFELAGSIR